MQKNETIQMANIIEAFAKINNDIITVFDKMETNIRLYDDFKIWPKHEKSRRNSKKDYYDFNELLDGHWYVKNCYGEINSRVYGFSFLIYIESDTDGYLNKFVKELELNPNAPMVCVYGVYNPVDPKQIEFTYNGEDDLEQWYMEVVGITEGWTTFPNETFEFGSALHVALEYQDEDGSIIEGYEKWFKEATVKIIPITDLDSSEKIEEVINDLMNLEI
jgi:hypothetical protein